MANYYCKYCGAKAGSIQSLTNGYCPRHPLGSAKGRHALYEGDPDSEYVCRYCGYKALTVQSLTNGLCTRRPAGESGNGRHEPFVGGIRSEYICKHCGYKASTLQSLTNGYCSRNPDTSGKGRHEPTILYDLEKLEKEDRAMDEAIKKIFGGTKYM